MQRSFGSNYNQKRLSPYGDPFPYEGDTAGSLIRREGYPPYGTYDQLPEVYKCPCCADINLERERYCLLHNTKEEKELERRRVMQLDVFDERAKTIRNIPSRPRISQHRSCMVDEVDKTPFVPPPPPTIDCLKRTRKEANKTKLIVTVHYGRGINVDPRDPVSVLVRCGAFEGQTAMVPRGKGAACAWEELFEFPYPNETEPLEVLVIDDALPEEVDHVFGGIVVPPYAVRHRQRGDEESLPVCPVGEMHRSYGRMKETPMGAIIVSWYVKRDDEVEEHDKTKQNLDGPLDCVFIVHRIFQYADNGSEVCRSGILAVLRDTDDNCSDSAMHIPGNGGCLSTSPYYTKEGYDYLPQSPAQLMQFITGKKLGHILVCVARGEDAGEYGDDKELLVVGAVPLDFEKLYHKGSAVLLVESKAKEEVLWGEITIEWKLIPHADVQKEIENHRTIQSHGFNTYGDSDKRKKTGGTESLFITVVRGINLCHRDKTPVSVAQVSVFAGAMEGSTYEAANEKEDENTNVVYWNQEVRFIEVDDPQNSIDVHVLENNQAISSGRFLIEDDQAVVVVKMHDPYDETSDLGEIVISYNRVRSNNDEPSKEDEAEGKNGSSKKNKNDNGAKNDANANQYTEYYSNGDDDNIRKSPEGDGGVYHNSRADERQTDGDIKGTGNESIDRESDGDEPKPHNEAPLEEQKYVHWDEDKYRPKSESREREYISHDRDETRVRGDESNREDPDRFENQMYQQHKAVNDDNDDYNAHEQDAIEKKSHHDDQVEVYADAGKKATVDDDKWTSGDAGKKGTGGDDKKSPGGDDKWRSGDARKKAPGDDDKKSSGDDDKWRSGDARKKAPGDDDKKSPGDDDKWRSGDARKKAPGGDDKVSSGDSDKKAPGGDDKWRSGDARKKAPGDDDKKSPGGDDKVSSGDSDKKAPGGDDKWRSGDARKKAPGDDDKKSPGGDDKVSSGDSHKKAPGDSDKKAPGDSDKKSPGGDDKWRSGDARKKAPGDDDKKSPGDDDKWRSGDARKKAPGDDDKKSPGDDDKWRSGDARKKAPGDDDKVSSGDSHKKAPGDSDKKAPGDDDKRSPGDDDKWRSGDARKKAPGDDDKKSPGDDDKWRSGDARKKAPGDDDKKSPGGDDKWRSGDARKKAPGDDDKWRSGDARKKAPGGDDKVSSGDSHKKAPGDSDKKAPGDDDKRSPGDDDKWRSGDARKKAPGDDDKKSPGDDDKWRSGDARKKAPGDDDKKSPGDDDKKSPGDDDKWRSGDARKKAPGDDDKKSPGDDDKWRSGDARKKAPGDDDKKSPGDDDKVSSGDFHKKAPGDSDKKAPGGDDKKSPGDDDKWTSGDARKKAPGGDDKVSSGDSDKKAPGVADKKAHGGDDKKVTGDDDKGCGSPRDKKGKDAEGVVYGDRGFADNEAYQHSGGSAEKDDPDSKDKQRRRLKEYPVEDVYPVTYVYPHEQGEYPTEGTDKGKKAQSTQKRRAEVVVDPKDKVDFDAWGGEYVKEVSCPDQDDDRPVKKGGQTCDEPRASRYRIPTGLPPTPERRYTLTTESVRRKDEGRRDPLQFQSIPQLKGPWYPSGSVLNEDHIPLTKRESFRQRENSIRELERRSRVSGRSSARRLSQCTQFVDEGSPKH